MGNSKDPKTGSFLDMSQEELESTYTLEELSSELKALLPRCQL